MGEDCPELFRVVHYIGETIKDYLEGVSLFLLEFINEETKVNPYLLVSEYVAYWTHFKESVEEVDEVVEGCYGVMFKEDRTLRGGNKLDL